MNKDDKWANVLEVQLNDMFASGILNRIFMGNYGSGVRIIKFQVQYGNYK